MALEVDRCCAQCALGGGLRARTVRGTSAAGGKDDRLSPAVMVLMGVTLRVNDSRIAEPSGSRRTEPKIVGNRLRSVIEREYPTGA